MPSQKARLTATRSAPQSSGTFRSTSSSLPYDAEKDLVAPSLTGTCAKWASSAPKVSNGGTNLGLNDKTAEREVLARADKDFERLFGAD
jgi:hypothetical protein